MIIFDKLFNLMETKGINRYYLRQNGVHANTVDKLSKNENIEVSTIDRLCQLLDCQPGDLMEYVPDEE